MSQKLLRQTIVGLLALAFATSILARGQFWDFLGCTQVDSGQVHSRILITRRNKPFHVIQLRVSGDAIFFDRLIVHFTDHTSEEFVVGGRISPEGQSYVMNLPREGRVLESVEFWYYKETWERTPRVSLYGVRPQEGDDPGITPI